MKNRYLLFLVFSLFPLTSNAAYTWTVSNISSNSAIGACTSYMNSLTSTTYSISSPSVQISTSPYSCSYVRTRISTGAYHDTPTLPMARSGSCDLPEVMNRNTGVCELPQNECSSKSGQSKAFTKAGNSGDGYGVIAGGFVTSSQSACFSGCAVSTADQKCTGRVSGKYTCRGTAYFTGQECSTTGTGTEVQENTAQLPEPKPEVINEEKPCVYSEVSGEQVCQSEKNTEKEGQFCGEVNGVKKCVDAKPTKNGISIDTKVKTETKPDGSTVTTKTDTATKTTCTGANQCSSTTTTTTTTTTKDSNGNTTGVTGSCTGEACPDKNTNPDGDGDGFGDCTGDDCGEGSGGFFETPEFEEVGTIAETTGAFIDRVESSPILSTVSSIGLNGQGSCSMGSTSTSIGTISASGICDNSHWLDPLYFIFLAIHALAAVRVFLSA